MPSGDTRPEILIRQASTAPTDGQPLAAVRAFQDFLADHLSTADYQTAQVLHLACVAPKVAAT